MEIIVVENLSFGYTEDNIINDLNLSIREGEIIVITGGNGSGKSTLIRLILGELSPKIGNIKLMGKNIEKLKNFKDIGYVPQGNVLDKIAFPLTCMELVSLNLYSDFGLLKIPKRSHKQRTKEILHEMDLDKYVNVPFNELSGGLQQRVLISRAMINNPKILILDEPTAGVDEESKNNFAKLIQELNNKKDITIVLVTHEVEWVKENLKLDNIYQMDRGGLENARI